MPARVKPRLTLQFLPEPREKIRPGSADCPCDHRQHHTNQPLKKRGRRAVRAGS